LNQNIDLALGNIKVSDILGSNVKQWNDTLITNMLGNQIGLKIHQTPLFDSVVQDKLIWRFD
jgi:hypothetical protein